MIDGRGKNAIGHGFVQQYQQRQAIGPAGYRAQYARTRRDMQRIYRAVKAVEKRCVDGYLHFARVLPAVTRSAKRPLATSG